MIKEEFKGWFVYLNEPVEVFTPYYKDRRSSTTALVTCRKDMIERGQIYLQHCREDLMTEH